MVHTPVSDQEQLAKFTLDQTIEQLDEGGTWNHLASLLKDEDPGVVINSLHTLSGLLKNSESTPPLKILWLTSEQVIPASGYITLR